MTAPAEKAACKWSEATEAYQMPATYGGDHGWKPVEMRLCCWGIYHPASAEALTSAPPWIVHLALAGAPVEAKTCANCHLWEAP
jgi:hypothetical protein